jgi:hypothetical protein
MSAIASTPEVGSRHLRAGVERRPLSRELITMPYDFGDVRDATFALLTLTALSG